MFCYNCGCSLSEHDFCTACGADVSLYKKIMHVSNMYYNEGLEKAAVRDLSGAITSLRQSLKFNKNHIDARNLLGLIYYETGETVAALSEWVISKNLRPEKNVADDYISRLQSNASRLESINQTIKKYNHALVYCIQDSKDLAVIQLKKVLSLNPRFVRAHQLLALLYMDSEQWDKAERELKKCLEIDRNNTMTLRYMREVEMMLLPDESLKQTGRKKKEESVRYQSDNEIIIQPVNVKEPKGGGVATLVNIGIGLIIGITVTYFLMVPAARSETMREAQKTITQISNESDQKAVRIKELESNTARLENELSELKGQVDSLVGNGGTMDTINHLLTVTSDYLLNQDIYATASELEAISESVNMEEISEGFRTLFGTLKAVIGPELSVKYATEGSEAFRTEDFDAAIDAYTKAVYYDPENADALFYLARSYHRAEKEEEAIAAYQSVIELFPDTERARKAKQFLSELGVS